MNDNKTEADLPTERFFTVVYKLTDANVAKYLSNRDWVTYVYADSMAELASLKERSAEPAGACAAELRRLHAELETLPVGYINRGIAPHTKGKTVFHEKPTRNLEERWWSRDEPVFLASQGQAPAQPVDFTTLGAAMRAIQQAIGLIGDPADERMQAVRRVLRGAVIVAEDDGKVAPLPGTAYAALPTSSHAGRVYDEGFLIGTCPLYTADKLHAFADATCSLRASRGQALRLLTQKEKDSLGRRAEGMDGNEWDQWVQEKFAQVNGLKVQGGSYEWDWE